MPIVPSPSSMPTRPISAGLALTELGLGAAQFGNLYRETTDEESHAAVAAAWDAGLRVFDTAPHYGLGLSERRLGAALAGRPRDEFVVSTKVGRLLVPDPSGSDRMDDQGFVVPAAFRREWDFSRDGILRSVESSLERLGLDRIDILYLHDPDEHWDEASTSGVSALLELRDQGIVRAIGAGMNQAAMLAEFIRRCDVDVMMVAGRHTLLEQGALEELLPIAQERGVGIVAVGVFNSGLLSSARVALDAHYNYQQAPPDLLARATRIAELCEEYGTTLPAAAIAYPLRHPAVVSVVVGARSAEQVTANARLYRASVPEALWDALEREGLVAQ